MIRHHFSAPLLALTLFMTSCSGTKNHITSVNAKEQCSELLESSRVLLSEQDFEAAMEKTIHALALSQENKLDSLEAESLCSLSTIETATYMDDQAWEHAVQAEGKAKKGGYTRTLASALLQKARVASYAEISPDFNRNDEAIAYLDEVVSICTELNDLSTLAEAYLEQSQVFVNKNRWNDKLDMSIYAKAGEALNKAEKLIPYIQNPTTHVKAAGCRIRYYRQNGDIEAAIEHCLNALESASEDALMLKMFVHTQLTQLYGAAGDMENALDSHRNYENATQRYMVQKSDSKLQEMETRYNTSLKEREILKKKNTILLLILVMVACFITIMYAFHRVGLARKRNEELKEQNKTKDQLLALVTDDLANPVNAQASAIIDFQKSFHSMSDAEIVERCNQLAEDAKSLDRNVTNYICDLMLSKKKAMDNIGLTEREIEVIRLTSEGKSSKEIAEALFISVRTVTNHKQNIYTKMGVSSSSEMLREARKMGLL